MAYKLTAYWRRQLKRLMDEHHERPAHREPVLNYRRRQPNGRIPPYAPPPPILEFFHKRYDWLALRVPYGYDWKGRTYRSLYHAFTGATVEGSDERPFQLIEYSTYRELRRLRAKGFLSTRSFDKDEWADIALSILMQKWGLREWGAQLIYMTGDSQIVYRSNHSEDRYWGTCRGSGFNIYGNALMAVRSLMVAKMPEVYETQQRDLRKAVHTYARVPYIDYHLHQDAVAGFTRSKCRMLREVYSRTSFRRNRN